MMTEYLAKWGQVKSEFAKCVKKQWVPNMIHWVHFYQTTTHQGIKTNNYVEAWHRVLKTQYIPPPKKHQIDKFVQILCHDVEVTNRNKHDSVDCGYKAQVFNEFQERSKKLADGYTMAALTILGCTFFLFLAM
ncbi:hypothetical protein PtB15_7B494 [Puccinia triticina]|nr:hypothetical protein PtB15_7B494 [Puccinia triticina]